MNASTSINIGLLLFPAKTPGDTKAAARLGDNRLAQAIAFNCATTNAVTAATRKPPVI
ncbi:hypothetical protein [Pantoea stewartii]|uniref:hypothetical protein n=1 Tax=Pantoea stewartii TaxID=66269 RepID=UPI00198149CB|nr:hypothetical protein [Pantoea stewartii]